MNAKSKHKITRIIFTKHKDNYEITRIIFNEHKKEMEKKARIIFNEEYVEQFIQE